MNQIWITKAGGPEVLEVRDAPDPVPAPGEVLIDVAASGVNFADLLARMGMYPDAPPLPCVVGYEVSGTVAALGPELASPHTETGTPGERERR
ncbi:MAG: alcohol dehydrogenase catalytic domain-containing protein, partial [Spirochaetota bacterium]